MLTFEELSAVLSRIEEYMEVPASLRRELSRRRIRAVVEYIIRDSGLTVASQVGSFRIRLGGRSITVPMEYLKAASLSHRLKLRALDLLHLAYANLISRLEFSITSFVTADSSIMAKATEIRESLGFVVKHPREAA